LYFTVISALSGASLATMIRWELAYPGSHFFKGDSLRYLQVITAHGLTMVFYVVIPLVFGFLANFLIPYHVGSKDVAFPRLNSLGFWFLPAGFLLISKPAFLRASFFKYFDKPSFYMNVIDFNLFDNFFYFYNGKSFYDLNTSNSVLTTKQWSGRKKVNLTNFFYYNYSPKLYSLQTDLITYSNSLWMSALNLFKIKKKKNYIIKCSNSIFNYVGMNFYYSFFFKT